MSRLTPWVIGALGSVAWACGPHIDVGITPVNAESSVGGSLEFNARVLNSQDSRIEWSVLPRIGAGKIDQSGRYTAAIVEGTDIIVATSVADRSRSATATVRVFDDLVDHRGAVIPRLELYAIWWGDPNAFPPDARGAVEAFLAGVSGTAYLGVASEYLRGAQPSTEFRGELQDSTTLPPASTPGTELFDEICRLLDLNGIAPKREQIFFVYAASYPSPIPSPLYCALHMAGECHGVLVLAAYVPNPIGSPCSGFVNAGGRDVFTCNELSLPAAVMVNSTAHELMESMLDPYGSAWVDSHSREVADKCVATRTCVQIGATEYKLQSLYSNRTHSCVDK